MTASVDKKKSGGLAGIIAGDSAICLCGAEEESLLYRGYRIEDLAKQASFEETAWLILRGRLPNVKELLAYKEELARLRDLPVNLKAILEQIPKNANMMDVLRSGCSLLGHFEPEEKVRGEFEIPDRLIACFGSMLLYWYKLHQTGKRINLQTGANSLAGHLLQLILGHPASPEHIKALDTSLILYAEHEFNASTFTVRSITSTMSDFYSAICGGIGALRGPLHGGANEAAMELIFRFKNEAEAEAGILSMLKNHELVMGFGHRVYTTKDPRSALVKEWAKRLSKEAGDEKTFAIAEKIEATMWKEKKLFPNLDFYSALVYRYIGIPIEMYTPMFVMARISGWSAHLLEQRKNNKLIRPLSHYTGSPPQTWIPLERR